MLQAVLSDCNAFITEALPEPRVLPVLLRTTAQNQQQLNHQQQLLSVAEVLPIVVRTESVPQKVRRLWTSSLQDSDEEMWTWFGVFRRTC